MVSVKHYFTLHITQIQRSPALPDTTNTGYSEKIPSFFALIEFAKTAFAIKIMQTLTLFYFPNGILNLDLD